MEFKDLIIGLIVFSLFGLGLFTFIITSQTDNGAAANINTNQLINSTVGSIQSQINATSVNTESRYKAFTNETGIVGSLSIIYSSLPVFLKTIGSSLIGFYNVTFGIVFNFLGIPTIVGGVIITILLSMVVIGIWVSIRGVGSV